MRKLCWRILPALLCLNASLAGAHELGTIRTYATFQKRGDTLLSNVILFVKDDPVTRKPVVQGNVSEWLDSKAVYGGSYGNSQSYTLLRTESNKESSPTYGFRVVLAPIP